MEDLIDVASDVYILAMRDDTGEAAIRRRLDDDAVLQPRTIEDGGYFPLMNEDGGMQIKGSTCWQFQGYRDIYCYRIFGTLVEFYTSFH